MAWVERGKGGGWGYVRCPGARCGGGGEWVEGTYRIGCSRAFASVCGMSRRIGLGRSLSFLCRRRRRS